MKIIAAYPCLGKTTITKLNKERCFDREFCESRSVLGMTPKQINDFFDKAADIIKLQYQANHYKLLFITEDERLLSRLTNYKSDIILVFPNAYDTESMNNYKKQVIKRSGQVWWNRVIAPEFPTLRDRLDKYNQEGWNLYLTDKSHPYIENVIDLPKDFILPGSNK